MIPVGARIRVVKCDPRDPLQGLEGRLGYVEEPLGGYATEGEVFVVGYIAVLDWETDRLLVFRAGEIEQVDEDTEKPIVGQEFECA